MVLPEINLEATKGQYALEDYIERDWTEHEGKSGQWLIFRCPFHSDDEPSFGVHVGGQHWKCFAGCGSGDIYDYIQMRMYGNIVRSGERVIEAWKVLTGQNFLPVLSEEARNYREDRKNSSKYDPPTMQQVKRFAQWADVALPYFEARKVAPNTVHARLLGAELEHPWKPYITADGERFQVDRKHYTIPYLMGDGVRGIQTRRDDNSIEAFWQTDRGCHVFEQVAGDMATKRQCSLSEFLDERNGKRKVTDKLYGPKYWRMPGSTGAIFNIDLLIKTQDGKPVFDQRGWPMLRAWGLVFAVESEITAMSLVDLGFPAVSICKTEGAHLDYAFSKCRQVVIIGDNDRNHINTATQLPWNPGQSKAIALRNAIGFGRIIYPHDPFKDANEMAQAGELTSWLAANGVHPSLPVQVAA